MALDGVVHASTVTSDSILEAHNLFDQMPGNGVDFHMGKDLFDTMSTSGLSVDRYEEAPGYQSASFHDCIMFDLGPKPCGLHNQDHSP